MANTTAESYRLVRAWLQRKDQPVYILAKTYGVHATTIKRILDNPEPDPRMLFRTLARLENALHAELSKKLDAWEARSRG